MQSRRCSNTVLAVLFLWLATPTVRAADILDNVPNDALGFIVIKNVGNTNDKTEQLLASLKLQFPGPLALLKMTTGVGQGLDPQGDVLLTVLPGRQPSERPQLGIWLPTADYNQFVTALDGTPTDGITAVSVVGEDLLVAKNGAWAVIMDPDQRDRMQSLLAATPAPPAKIAAWKNWIDTNNVTAMLLPNGWQALWTWAATDRGIGIAAPAAPTANGDDEDSAELFGVPSEQAERDIDAMESNEGDLWLQLRHKFRAQLRAIPQLTRWAAEADAIACGIRIDAEGNSLAGIRIAMQDDWQIARPRDVATSAEPPALFRSGDCIVSATARLHSPLAVAAAGVYAQRIAEELKNEYRVALDDEAAGRFQKAVEDAVIEVTAATVLTRPGEKPDATYSNAFVALGVTGAERFADRFADVMRLWNEMNKSEQDESQLVFKNEATEIGGRPATVYSLDMAEAFGAAAIPEVRPSMERLFGPGGKLRLTLLTADEHTVLLAIATEEHIEPLVGVLRQNQSTKWDERTNRLLPGEAEWRVMFNPQGHTRWMKRQMEAMLGTVIGAPLVRQFPPSPPIGAAGGFKSHEIWADAAIPADTIRAAGQYLNQR
jgi:hypothetical protein